jgi:hypothetical protein
VGHLRRIAGTNHTFDDVGLQRPQDGEQLLLFLRENIELVQRFHEILDEYVEVGVSVVHSGVHHARIGLPV